MSDDSVHADQRDTTSLGGRWPGRDDTRSRCEADAAGDRLVSAEALTHAVRHLQSTSEPLKPNSITLAGSELAPNRFGASSEPAPYKLA